MPRRGLDARRLRALARLPARAAAARRRRLRRARPLARRRARARVLPRRARPRRPRTASAATSTSSRASTPSAPSPTRARSCSGCCSGATSSGSQAFAANHEFMNSQYEINVKHAGALDAADRAFMLKAAVKEIAAREGLLATFMGRPFADQGGSGFHVHLSLADDDGHNAFADEGGPDGLSPLAAQFIAGVIEHAQGLQALLGPTVNAYKRILPDSLAPDARELGPRQPHRVLPRPERARLAGPGRDPHRRRLRLPAPDHRGRPARRSRRDRARARRRPSRSSATPTALDEAHAGSALPVRPRRRARRARGRHRARREARRRSSSARSSR